MKRVLCVQFRSDQSLQHERTCIIRHAPKGVEVTFALFDELKGGSESAENVFEDFDKVILGGLGEADFTDEKSQLVGRIKQQTLTLVRWLVDHDIPTLGACFGHQLLAVAAGGTVAHDYGQAETGIAEIILNKNGQQSAIFAGMPTAFKAVVGHKDSVVTLPPKATLLASNATTTVQAFRLGKNVYGMQFHGELDVDDLIERLRMYPEYKAFANKTKYEQTPFAPKVLTNFLTM